MKTLAIASFTGAVILYIYLALAHTVLSIHTNDFKYTAAQGEILQVLNSSNLEGGFYFLPAAPPNSSTEEQIRTMKEIVGKPGALINYFPAVEGPGARMFIMSFIYNLISVLIICIALATAIPRLPTFSQRLWYVMLFALFVIFSEIMLQYNWIGFPMHYLKGEIIDQVVGYFLVGIWLAWYYGRLTLKSA